LLIPIAVLATALPALAQSRELKLDENGEWLSTRQPVEGSDEWTIDRARQDLADDRPGAAYSTIDAWIKKNDRKLNVSLVAAAGGGGTPGAQYFAEALLIRGDSLTAQGDEYNALYDYERVIKEFPGTDTFVTAVERELDIGVRYLDGMKRRFMGVRILPAEDIGEELVIRVQERLPGSRLAERAGIDLADYYYKNHDLSLASEAYDLFLDNYRNSQYAMKAMQRRVYSTIAQFKGPKYDGSKLLDAQVLVKRFASLYPNQARQAGLDDALLARLDESAGLSMLESANWYLSRGDTPSGRYTLQRLLETHPQTAAARTAMQTLEKNGWKLTPPKRRVAPVEPDETSDVPAAPPAPSPAPASPSATPATKPPSEKPAP
jgi:hypothetical protein